ncbi:MAG: dihydrofolate reductase [Flavobacteriales bacterium]|nr:dihydrofolate reductase [Flavobacteriales bacterium]MCB9203458.1 dihydrofolate reductase [Flavobacteriales bacterium]
MISMIVAADENNVIGKDNQLIWHLPDDLKFFKRMTSGHAIIMGRHTFESVGKPLPNRTNIIITRDKEYRAEGCVVVNSLEAALDKAYEVDPDPFIVGGEQIYRLALPLANTVYLTRVHHEFVGDRHFPELGQEWQETESVPHQADENHAQAFTIKTYRKR